MQRPTGRVVVQTPDGHVGLELTGGCNSHLIICRNPWIAVCTKLVEKLWLRRNRGWVQLMPMENNRPSLQCSVPWLNIMNAIPMTSQPVIGIPMIWIPMKSLNHRIICDSAAFPAQVPLHHHHHLQEPVGLQRSPALVGLQRHHPSTASCWSSAAWENLDGKP